MLKEFPLPRSVRSLIFPVHQAIDEKKIREPNLKPSLGSERDHQAHLPARDMAEDQGAEAVAGAAVQLVWHVQQDPVPGRRGQGGRAARRDGRV